MATAGQSPLSACSQALDDAAGSGIGARGWAGGGGGGFSRVGAVIVRPLASSSIGSAKAPRPLPVHSSADRQSPAAQDEIVAHDDLAARKRRCPPHAILKFAHVAGKKAALEHIHRAGRQRQLAAVLGVEALEEGAREQRDVARPFAQRRQEHRNDIDAVVEVGAELALGDRLLEVLVGRADEPDVDLQRARAADPLELALLKHAQQLGLEARRNLADFVEQQRAAMRELEAAGALADGAGEGALLVAEQLGFEHAFRQRGAIELDERLVLARREIVHGAGEQLLAGAAFPAQQHGRIRFGDDFDLLHALCGSRRFRRRCR